MLLVSAFVLAQSNDVLLRRVLPPNEVNRYNFQVAVNLRTLLPSGLGQDDSRVAVSGQIIVKNGVAAASGVPVKSTYQVTKASATGLVGAGVEERGGLKSGFVNCTIDVLGRPTISSVAEKSVAEMLAGFVPFPLGQWPGFASQRVAEGAEWKLTIPDITYAFVNATLIEVKRDTAIVEVRGSYSEDTSVQFFVLRSKAPVKTTEISKVTGEFEIDLKSGKVMKGKGRIETRADATSEEGFDLVSNREVEFSFTHVPK